MSKESRKAARDNLSDAYVRQLLCRGLTRLKAADIPAALVDMKREQIEVLRLSRQLKGAVKNARLKR